MHQESLNQLEFPFFEIFHNLLVSCFPNFETYKNILKLTYEASMNGQKFEKCEYDKESSSFMDILVQSGFIYQILTFLPDIKFNIKDKIYAIKCLLIMQATKNVMQIVSVMQQKFIPIFERSLIITANSKNSHKKTRSFLIYSFRLIYIINRYKYFKFIDHTSFQTFFRSERKKVEKSLIGHFLVRKSKQN
ncbi:hypothetical protein MXB_5679 [Myxobolus squamalis]|nr:hypothetical protein MXB_5679 [Myxobolus squamalis]